MASGAAPGAADMRAVAPAAPAPAAAAAAASAAAGKTSAPVQWQTEMNTVYQGGVDEGREAMDADKITAKKDYGHLYSHFDYATTGKWLQQTCRQPVSDASGAFVARALELLLRDTIDNVLEIARVRQNQPKTEMFEGTGLEVTPSGIDVRDRLAAMAKSSAALAKESTSQLAAVTTTADKQKEKWGALADQNKAVASSIAMIDRKRKQGSAASEEAKRQRLAAARAAAAAPDPGASSVRPRSTPSAWLARWLAGLSAVAARATEPVALHLPTQEAANRAEVPGVPAGQAGLADVLQYCRRNPQLHKSPQLNHYYSKLK